MDNLDKKPDEYIKGLIAYKISECSYMWKTAREVEREVGGKDYVEILTERMALGSEEYERNVDKEAKRLGLINEILVYDMPS